MYAARNTLSRLRAHGTPHQSGNMPTLLLTRLASDLKNKPKAPVKVEVGDDEMGI